MNPCRSYFGRIALTWVLLLALSGCGEREQAPAPGATRSSGDAFTILAGSELRDVERAMQEAARQVGVPLAITYAGTLDIVERINGGERFDAILPPNGAYPTLALASKPLAREKLFYSRVALGVKASRATALGWDQTPPTWADIARAAKEGKFRYAMTNPTTSNTGMSALFAVASAVAGKTEDLQVRDVNPNVLKDFLSGQKITAGSSGWLADVYVKEPGAVDGLVNYEAVILRLNAQLPRAEQLRLIYPKDGVISADYPLLLLNEARRGDYNRLVSALKGATFQREALAPAFLRPSSPEAPVAPALPTEAVAELAFPNSLAVIDEVLAAYSEQWRRPATSIFVLDVSGSMEGQRLADMRKALAALAGAEPSGISGRYLRFQSRERVILVPFASTVAQPQLVAFSEGNVAQSRQGIVAFAGNLQAKGGTAVYSALRRAQQEAAAELKRDPQRYVSIVLLTDGENNAGISLDQFAAAYDKALGVRIFPVLFGEGNVAEMNKVAAVSGGRTFDARQVSLAAVFKEIRGYQ